MFDASPIRAAGQWLRRRLGPPPPPPRRYFAQRLDRRRPDERSLAGTGDYQLSYHMKDF
jgi:hypothetical protein